MVEDRLEEDSSARSGTCWRVNREGGTYVGPLEETRKVGNLLDAANVWPTVEAARWRISRAFVEIRQLDSAENSVQNLEVASIVELFPC